MTVRQIHGSVIMHELGVSSAGIGEEILRPPAAISTVDAEPGDVVEAVVWLPWKQDEPGFGSSG